MSLVAGEVISYLEMCREEEASLQRGMNFRLHPSHSVILMSLRRGAPYSDAVVDNGKALVYEGHDIPRTPGGPYPKQVDQPITSPYRAAPPRMACSSRPRLPRRLARHPKSGCMSTKRSEQASGHTRACSTSSTHGKRKGTDARSSSSAWKSSTTPRSPSHLVRQSQSTHG